MPEIELSRHELKWLERRMSDILQRDEKMETDRVRATNIKRKVKKAREVRS